MLKSRVIPALLLDDKGIYKTIKFENPRYIGDPLNIIKIFNDKLVDEIFICDINRNNTNKIDFDYLKTIFQSCRMPVCYSGRISDLKQASTLFSIGVEKVGIGKSIIENPNLINLISKTFGNQSMVSILNLVNIENKSFIYDYSKKKIVPNLDVIDFIKIVQEYGSGEIILHFVNNDGLCNGYDYEIINKLLRYIKVPVTFLGGLKNVDEINYVVKKYGVTGIAGSSIFIYKGKFKSVLINYPTNLLK